jgi:type VI secretion system secreted protein VgrG
VNEEIRIQAQSKVELIGGQSKIVLEGGNVTFTCPGKFEVKSSTHNLLGGGSKAAALPALPIDLAKLKPDDLLLDYKHVDGSPVQGAPFEVTFADGSKRSGTLDASGRAVLNAVPPGLAKVHYGEDARKSPEGEDESNPLAGWM